MASFNEAPPGDAKAGEKIFRTKCAQCHTVDKGAGHKQGPNLNGLFNRQSGTLPLGILTLLPTKTWLYIGGRIHSMITCLILRSTYQEQRLFFPGLKKPQERADLIAYLKEATS